jgi:cytochrome c
LGQPTRMWQKNTYLVNKIGQGGSGVWGVMNMPGFSGLSLDDRRALASYVLSLAEGSAVKSLPMAGALSLAESEFSAANYSTQAPFAASESFVIDVSFADKSIGAIASVKATAEFRLLPARIAAADLVAGAVDGEAIALSTVAEQKSLRFSALGDWRGLTLLDKDLTDISALILGFWGDKVMADWQLEIREHNAQGALLVAASLRQADLDAYQRLRLPLPKKLTAGQLYVQLKSPQSGGFLHLGDIAFERSQ